ncbi:MAG: cation diffusion facilitator family transporter [Ignavibacteriales bacterium]|nr:cation diffusion facilitator family transporter [Ignavibacteriales bacterium]
MTTEKIAAYEKRKIALTSVIAAVFLTSFKLLIGFLTGSLGILSEAMHSGLDLVAATITLFAVKFADKPADSDHNYGHGKIENYSALIETLLLLLTCAWIIYEAVKRLVTGKVEIEVTIWSFIVIITSIIIDVSRSKALYRVAKKHNSQALEADALHFSTDIWSSSVVLIGLVGAAFQFYYADSISALIVAIIVLVISFRLGKRSFDTLIDKAPEGLNERISSIINEIPEVIKFHNVRVRESGPYKFVELNIHVDKQLSIDQAHKISHKVEEAILQKIENINVTVHIEPEVEKEQL